MGLVADMGVNGAGDEILQPMLKNRFRVTFQGIGSSALSSADTLTLQVITADRPKLSFDEVILDRYNSKAYIPGKHQFEPVSMVFESDIGGNVIRTIQDQLETQQKLIGMGSAPRLPTARSGSRFKFATVIEQLDGDNVVFETWYLEGCWIQHIDYGDLDYSASETVKVTMTLRFDHARQDITGISGKATGGAAAEF